MYGLFAACIPQQSRGRFDGLPVRKRQGLVPDLRITMQWDCAGPERALLFEIKTLHHGSSTYPYGRTERCQAVARRAAAIPAEYARKARRVDGAYCGTLSGSTGPVERRLQTFDPVKGLVFGAFGEASPDVHRLLSALAHAGSMRHYRRMQAQDPEETRGALAWLMRRRWALTAARENARLTLSRLEFVGRGSGAAAARRTEAEGRAARARRAACASVRGWRVTAGRHGL